MRIAKQYSKESFLCTSGRGAAHFLAEMGKAVIDDVGLGLREEEVLQV